MTATDSLGVRIREIRKRTMGMTQAQLAAALGLKRAETVSDWERGEILPPRERLEDLARLAGMDADEAFGELRSDAADEEDDPLDEWPGRVLEMVRYQSGYPGADAAEVKRIKRDILEGCVRLGRMTGKDVQRLEVELSKLEGAMEPDAAPDVTPAALLSVLDRESRAAENRSVAAVDLAAAVRIEAEETRERRTHLAALQRPGPGYVLSELTPDERRRYELWRREQEERTPAGGPPPAPEPRPGGPRPSAGA